MHTMLAVLGMSGGELVLVFAAILILFGAKRIPDFAKGLGQGIREFKKHSRDVTDEFQNAMHSEPSPPPSPPPPQKQLSNSPEAVVSSPSSTVPKA